MMLSHISPLYVIGIISIVGNIYFLTDKYDLSSILSGSTDSFRRSLISIQSDIKSLNGFEEDPITIRRLESKKPDSMRVIGEKTHTDKIYHHRY